VKDKKHLTTIKEAPENPPGCKAAPAKRKKEKKENSHSTHLFFDSRFKVLLIENTLRNHIEIYFVRFIYFQTLSLVLKKCPGQTDFNKVSRSYFDPIGG
jgi:hypothetical protein